MEPTLEQLYRETVPKPGCPGTRIDSEGREWYSAAWLDQPLYRVTTEEEFKADGSVIVLLPACPRCRSTEVALGLDADEEPNGEFECLRCGMEFDAE